MNRQLATCLAACVLACLTLTAGLGGVAVAADDGLGGPGAGTSSIPVTVTVPGAGTGVDAPGELAVRDAELRWTLNHESGAAAYFGGCNFLMAGVPGTDGDTGGSDVWEAADGYYRAKEGNVRVERPRADGSSALATFGTRCRAADGRTVSIGNNLSTGTEVVLDAGTGTVDPAAGTAEIRWKGTFTVVFYGGMTYWWASDPVLRVAPGGTGTLTATAGGFGASRDDASQWVALREKVVTLATLPRVSLDGDKGFESVPTYRGVAVGVPAGGVPQVPRTASNAAHWGSFPQDFVDFQQSTGQAAYWYSSGGARDSAKVAAPLAVSFDAADPVVRDPDLVPDAGPPGPTATAVRPPASLTPGTANGTAAPTAAPGRVHDAPGAARSPLDTTEPPFYPAVAASTVGGGQGLVPTGATVPSGPVQRLAIWGTGLLLAAAGAVHGFRKGWLVLPFRT
ncbi:hypothetical protein [Cellulosimicrobium arenosum]|uniref:Htaa domain-containing protein n=1 Tax=Cellulosimicrobium arenosum TaxID=2708133 RepID=A0A927J1B6_9MICO|nr:hypothetical protein [Cellulosimicrobium arenosum]MBD8080079.1 hypothetical protein [Cellulosimicrobium arenosum]